MGIDIQEYVTTSIVWGLILLVILHFRSNNVLLVAFYGTVCMTAAPASGTDSDAAGVFTRAATVRLPLVRH